MIKKGGVRKLRFTENILDISQAARAPVYCSCFFIIAIFVEPQWKERAVNGLPQGGSMWDDKAWANCLGVCL
jgi:hypothetical protein